jgi:hypothetical protein
LSEIETNAASGKLAAAFIGCEIYRNLWACAARKYLSWSKPANSQNPFLSPIPAAPSRGWNTI